LALLIELAYKLRSLDDAKALELNVAFGLSRMRNAAEEHQWAGPLSALDVQTRVKRELLSDKQLIARRVDGIPRLIHLSVPKVANMSGVRTEVILPRGQKRSGPVRVAPDEDGRPSRPIHSCHLSNGIDATIKLGQWRPRQPHTIVEVRKTIDLEGRRVGRVRIPEDVADAHGASLRHHIRTHNGSQMCQAGSVSESGRQAS
jgi:hypothetical protein